MAVHKAAESPAGDSAGRNIKCCMIYTFSKFGYYREGRGTNKNPLQFAAQEYVAGAQTPTWHQGQIQPRASVLRTFAVASESSYSVMPGGLTRVNLDPDKKIISNQRGSVSKDTWVLGA